LRLDPTFDFSAPTARTAPTDIKYRLLVKYDRSSGLRWSAGARRLLPPLGPSLKRLELVQQASGEDQEAAIWPHAEPLSLGRDRQGFDFVAHGYRACTAAASMAAAARAEEGIYLPRAMSRLTQLTALEVRCRTISSLGKGIRPLTQLRRLEIDTDVPNVRHPELMCSMHVERLVMLAHLRMSDPARCMAYVIAHQLPSLTSLVLWEGKYYRYRARPGDEDEEDEDEDEDEEDDDGPWPRRRARSEDVDSEGYRTSFMRRPTMLVVRAALYRLKRSNGDTPETSRPFRVAFAQGPDDDQPRPVGLDELDAYVERESGSEWPPPSDEDFARQMEHVTGTVEPAGWEDKSDAEKELL
jgi:hypothetical protein